MIPETLRKIMEEGRCCSCGGPLKGSEVHFVMLLKVATWRFPVWGNILVPEIGMRAIAVVCDRCEAEKAGVKQAVEIDEGEFRYHDLSSLEDAEPITEEMVKKGEERIRKEGTRHIRF